MTSNEDYVDGIFRVYNNPICEVIDNYNASAYYEPSYVIARAYQNGGFWVQKKAVNILLIAFFIFGYTEKTPGRFGMYPQIPVNGRYVRE